MGYVMQTDITIYLLIHQFLRGKRKWIAILLLAILCTDSHSFYSLEYSQVSGVTSVCFFLIDTLPPRIYYANGKVASEHYVHTLLDTFFQNYIKRIKLFLKIPFMNDLKYFPRPLTFRIRWLFVQQQYSTSIVFVFRNFLLVILIH